MTARAAFVLAVFVGLSGCASDYTLYDGWPAPGYVWDPQHGYVPSYTSASVRYGNPFYRRSSYYDPYYCPPYLNTRYGGAGYYGRTYGRVYPGARYYSGYGRVDPDKKLKRERKQERKELKRQQKQQRKLAKRERKLEKRTFKQERKLQKRQAKFQRKLAKKQAKQQRKALKRQRKAER